MLPTPGEEHQEHPSPGCAGLSYALISLPGNTARLATRLRTSVLLKRHSPFGFRSLWPSHSRPRRSRPSGHVDVPPREGLRPRGMQRSQDREISLGLTAHYVTKQVWELGPYRPHFIPLQHCTMNPTCPRITEITDVTHSASLNNLGQ